MVDNIDKKRIAWLDLAKGVGIFLILYVHLFPSYEILRITIISFIVPYFFVISGYSMNWDMSSNTFARIKKDFYRLIFPYFIYLIISLPIYLFYLTDLPIYRVIRLIFYIDGYTISFNAALWFLIALFEVKLIFNLFFYNKQSMLFHLSSMIICILIAWLLYRSGVSTKWMFGINKALICLPFFIFGVWLRKKSLLEKINNKCFWGILLIFLSGLLANYIDNLESSQKTLSLYSWNLNSFWGFILVSFFASVGLILICRIAYPNRILMKLSNHTIFIMATHYPFTVYWKSISSHMSNKMVYLTTFLVLLFFVLVYFVILYYWDKLKYKLPS